MRLTPLLMLIASLAVAAGSAPRAAAAADPRPVDWTRSAVIDCTDGRVHFFDRDDAGRLAWRARSVPLDRVEQLDCPEVPALAAAERFDADDRPDDADSARRFVIAEHAAGRAPSWAATVARARLMETAAHIGDVEAAAEHVIALAELRPAGWAGFLPAHIDGWEPVSYNAAVRRLQRALAGAIEDERDGDAFAAALERMRCRLPRASWGPGFFGTVPRARQTTVFVIDAGSFTPAGLAAVRRGLLEAIHRMRSEAGQSFAVFTGPEPWARFPAVGTAPATLAQKHAVNDWLRNLAPAGEPGIGPAARRAALLPEPKTMILASADDVSDVPAQLRAAGIAATAVRPPAVPTPDEPAEDFPAPPDAAAGRSRIPRPPADPRHSILKQRIVVISGSSRSRTRAARM